MEEKFASARKQFLMVLALSTLIVALTEVALYIYVQKPSKVSWQDYCVGNFYVPLAINLSVVVAIGIIINSPNIKPIVMNYACAIGFVILCTVVVTAHNDYPVLLAVFVIPVLWSTVFEDKLLCSVTHLLCQIGILQLTVTSSVLSSSRTIIVDADDLAEKVTDGIKGGSKVFDGDVLLNMSDDTRINTLWLNIILGILLVALARLFGHLMLVHLQKKDTMLQSHEKDNMALEKQLLRDQMTGLYNHTAFYEFLDRCVKMKGDEPLTLAVVDIDDFKKVNDTYGHDNGDEVILTLSKIMQDYCGSENYVCRYGGEEFAVIFPNSREKEARQTMMNILDAFRNTHYDWHSGSITFSCGVFQCSPYRMNAEEFFQITDKLLYKAKHNGKNQVCGG
ncbi:MAG: GGDEF domain-containing protein [Lachnospiraceae bacterium]|nr:GGDEF domain-containing protein [Lachnospiraceae bacterium]